MNPAAVYFERVSDDVCRLWFLFPAAAEAALAALKWWPDEAAFELPDDITLGLHPRYKCDAACIEFKRLWGDMPGED